MKELATGRLSVWGSGIDELTQKSDGPFCEWRAVTVLRQFTDASGCRKGEAQCVLL